jgi:hypothetical protein
MAAAVVQLDGSVLIWHMIDWFSTACCLYGARSKNEHALYSLSALCSLRAALCSTRCALMPYALYAPPVVFFWRWGGGGGGWGGGGGCRAPFRVPIPAFHAPHSHSRIRAASPGSCGVGLGLPPLPPLGRWELGTFDSRAEWVPPVGSAFAEWVPQ